MEVHILSSPLYRPNGIIEYIRAHLSLEQGFVITDARPNYDFSKMFVTKHLDIDPYYKPSIVNNHLGNQVPCLDWNDKVVEDLVQSIKKHVPFHLCTEYYAHCAKSFAAAKTVGLPVVFVQHESDIYKRFNPYFLGTLDLSYMSEEWLKYHSNFIIDSNTTIATLMRSKFNEQHGITPKQIIMPYPIEYSRKTQTAYEGDVVLIADGSYRKGWHRYLELWLEKRPKTNVISHEKHSAWPKEWNVVSFDLFDTENKLQYIRNHMVAVIPSISEGYCIAAHETLSQIPTIFFYFTTESWYSHYSNHANFIEASALNPSYPNYFFINRTRLANDKVSVINKKVFS